MGVWGYFQYPTEPPGLSDEAWWRREAEFACEDDAVPTYDELMEQYDNEVVDHA